MSLIVQQDRIYPIRGLLFTHNARGRAIDLTALKKWLRLNASAYKAEKIDVFVAPGGEDTFEALLDFAPTQSTRLSLRCNVNLDIDRLEAWKSRGLFDVLLVARDAADAALARWIAACTDLDIPFRVELYGAMAPTGGAPETLLKDAVCVNINIADPFAPATAPAVPSTPAVASLNALTQTLSKHGVEVNLQHLPFCHVDEENLPYAQNEQQYFLDHQQYSRSAWLFAVTVWNRPSHAIDKAAEIHLTRQTSFHNVIDNAVLPWIFEHPFLYIRVWALHKLTRHLSFLRHRPQPLPENASAAENAVEKLREAQKRTLGPVCAQCRYQAICSHATERFRATFPDLPIAAQPGPLILDAQAFNREQPKHYDVIDEARRHPPVHQAVLAAHVRNLIAETPPTREFNETDYVIEDHETHPMPGAVRWFSFTNAELQSSVLTQLQPPFTLSTTFGGGLASHIGFSFGRHAKIYCPMIGTTHALHLHVNADGQYVLLRDGEPVRPTEFEDAHYLPRKLAGVVEPRIAILNVDGQISTQRVLLWDESVETKQSRQKVAVSVVIVSTCYSRRLQAVLLALVNQRDVDLATMEVIIGYVPGVDATDDLIDGLRLTHPQLRIVRSPFPPNKQKSKGFMLNLCMDMAAGEWIVLLDSDIMLPPDFMAKLLALPDTARFAAPDGRRMLSPTQTAQILLGECRPWEDYETLAESDTEYRHHESDGIPPGFCQCVRKEVIKTLRYPEFDHFEGADWWFAKEVKEQFGPLARFEAMKVLHLDHGGSQWYGAGKQM